MISLKTVTEADKKLLYSLLQKYLYEMAQYYDDLDIEEDGNYEYDHFDDYFTDDTRKAFFILKDDKVAGFVMLNRISYIGETPDYVIAEFCVLPKYRKAYVAKRTFEILCETYPGKWEIRHTIHNIPAARLWSRVTETYQPRIKMVDDEKIFSFDTTK